MGWIEVDGATDERLRMLGRTWGVAKGEALARVLDEWEERSGQPPLKEPVQTREPKRRDDIDDRVPVYFDYQGVRNSAWFDPVSGQLEITAGPATGRTFPSPSAAASKIVGLLNPSIVASRNGWITWKLVETDELLDTLRTRGGR